MNEIQGNLSRLTTSYLLVHGDGDQLVKIDGSHYLHENSPSNDKTFKEMLLFIIKFSSPSGSLKNNIEFSHFGPFSVYKNGRHELLNEVEETASVVYKDILDWIQQKLS
ncbi:unnamed protein product [Porites lobata]|uniref:Serine aminopeptidase S33 domain-containing protein n=1 Tax=Porites lobata TaxID=104759 RepID=A0ABN8PUE0_9CNID|nr:unnamed protein product [Porites lobata]